MSCYFISYHTMLLYLTWHNTLHLLDNLNVLSYTILSYLIFSYQTMIMLRYVTLCEQKGFTALTKAAIGGHLAIVRTLLDLGANPEAVNKVQYNVIRYDMTWCDMIWHDMIWYDMIRCVMYWFTCLTMSIT